MNRLLWSLLFSVNAVSIGAAEVNFPPRSDAPISTVIQNSRMRVEVVSGIGSLCPTACPRWIAMEGRITADSVGDVIAAIAAMTPDPPVVVVNSSGGDLPAALAIGRMLRQFDAVVIVGHTVFSPPRSATMSNNRAAAGQRPVGTCHSACVYVLAGGKQRIAGEHTRVGVHRPVEVTTTTTQRPIDTPIRLGDELHPSHQHVTRSPIAETAPLVMDLRRYMTEMGVDDTLVDWSIETSPSRIRGLTWSEMLQTRLLTTAPLP